MPPFKDEHVLIIAPGSQTTLAQLGLPESFTPARWRFPTRMFPGAEEGKWEPHKVLSKKHPDKPAVHDLPNTNGDRTPAQPDTDMVDAPVVTNGDQALQTEPEEVEVSAESQGSNNAIESSTDTGFEDDPLDTEGAIYPLQGGHITNFPCLFALLSHIYNMLSPPFHSPILIISQPCWSARDNEFVTQFFFENFRTPAFCIMDSALAACYAYGVASATVVDVGHDKCDVTAVSDFMVSEFGRAAAVQGCGGRGMTQRLHQLLEDQGFTEGMAEQLKRSPICEILPVGTALPTVSQQVEPITNPAAAASTGAVDSGANAKDVDGLRPGQEPRGPGAGTTVGEEGGNGEDDDNEGVLDVATIVAGNNAAEVLAKREAEKAAKAAAKKGALDAARQIRLKNFEREKATFQYEEVVSAETAANANNGTGGGRKRKREVEVGVERFMASSPAEGDSDGVLDKIAAAIHNTILTFPDPAHRSTLWENVIILGQGSRVRGFTPALLSVLASRFTLSPSTATMFTSELPSNFSTPLATTPGTNTPIPGMQPHPQHHPAAHGVNPLLVAATRSNMPQHLQVPGPQTPDLHHPSSQRMHSQTPTSVKTVKPPEYFPEWKDPSVSGMEEAGFLGAQVAAKVIFIADQGLSKGFLSRVEYNEMGPLGIHDCSM